MTDLPDHRDSAWDLWRIDAAFCANKMLKIMSKRARLDRRVEVEVLIPVLPRKRMRLPLFQ